MAADWLEAIDNYCERTGPELFSEPLNAASNAAFLIAAFLLWRRYRAAGVRDKGAAFLIVMVAVVGVGSLSFHTFANRLTMMADVIPIVVFVLSFMAVGFRRLAGLGAKGFALIYSVFFAAAFALGKLPPEMALNGSVGYLPCLMVLVVLAAICRDVQAKKSLAASAGLFTLSLVMRTGDAAWCEMLPIGTHFIWHCLNGVLLWRLVRSVMDARR